MTRLSMRLGYRRGDSCPRQVQRRRTPDFCGLGFEALEDRRMLASFLNLNGVQTPTPGAMVNVSDPAPDDDAFDQSEMLIVANPTNPLNLVGFTHTLTSPITLDVYRSLDGGNTWTNTNTFDGTLDDGLGNVGNRFDPAIAPDAVAPTVNVVDVTPDPRTTSVTSIAIDFSEAVTGFSLADLALARNGGANLLPSSATLVSADQIHWTLGNLSGLTGISGSYLLTLTAAGSGIADVAGNPLIVSATDAWTANIAAPPGDANGDGIVNIFDVNLVSSNWGTTGPAGDVNHDGTVNIFDINLISANWSPSPGGGAGGDRGGGGAGSSVEADSGSVDPSSTAASSTLRLASNVVEPDGSTRDVARGIYSALLSSADVSDSSNDGLLEGHGIRHNRNKLSSIENGLADAYAGRRTPIPKGSSSGGHHDPGRDTSHSARPTPAVVKKAVDTIFGDDSNETLWARDTDDDLLAKVARQRPLQ